MGSLTLFILLGSIALLFGLIMMRIDRGNRPKYPALRRFALRGLNGGLAHALSIVYLVALASVALNLRSLSFSRSAFEGICAFLTLVLTVALAAFTLQHFVSFIPKLHYSTVYSLQLRLKSVVNAPHRPPRSNHWVEIKLPAYQVTRKAVLVMVLIVLQPFHALQLGLIILSSFLALLIAFTSRPYETVLEARF